MVPESLLDDRETSWVLFSEETAEEQWKKKKNIFLTLIVVYLLINENGRTTHKRSYVGGTLASVLYRFMG